VLFRSIGYWLRKLVDREMRAPWKW